MKIFKILAVALVAMLGFTACDKECGHDFIDYDHSADIVGTWTCMDEDFAEALVISADGSVASTRLFSGEYREDIKGKIVVENGTVNLTFEDGGNFKSHFDIIPGMAFSIFNEDGERLTFNYCANDLSDEVIGMWVVANGTPDMTIETFNEDGTAIFTGIVEGQTNLNSVINYKVVGDLMFYTITIENKQVIHTPYRLIYSPDATSYGDIMTWQLNDDFSFSRLRIKQYLELPGESYDYSNIYVTNVKATDAEFEFAGQTLNFANMDGKFLDKMMKNLLFNVSFPSADEIVYNYHYNGETVPMPSPIVVDGNKMTIKKSVNNPAYKDIDVWTFQDQDNTQMHMYMPTYAFENFLANTIVEMMSNEGKLDLSNTEKVAEIYAAVTEAIETINVSFIFKAAK